MYELNDYVPTKHHISVIVDWCAFSIFYAANMTFLGATGSTHALHERISAWAETYHSFFIYSVHCNLSGIRRTLASLVLSLPKFARWKLARVTGVYERDIVPEWRDPRDEVLGF